MDSYQIEWKHSAKKELRKLPPTTIKRIVSKVEDLANEPYPPGCRKLAGYAHSWRIRVGDYRVVYDVFEGRLVIEIIRVAHRKEVYR
jgi:mRNA interferase RelE/StbE